MSSNVIQTLLSGKRYLLLQGPMGPFFNDMADRLEKSDREAVNVIFNGGDRYYCRKREYKTYHGRPEAFSGWLKELWQNYPFDTILCFGDCRPLHQAARKWAEAKGLSFFAFEEGYLRPHFITMEKGGVNAYSSLPRDPAFYRQQPEVSASPVEKLKPSTCMRMWHATWYYLVSWYSRHEFANYRHHKSLSPWYEARCWFRAGWRKQLYRILQNGITQRLKTTLSQRYYLAILQVYNDSQIRNHSSYKDVRNYINDVVYSFSRNAPQSTYLIIKHHPMDRGHRLYKPLIKRLCKKYDVEGRIIYVHDVSLPVLLTHAKAVITINSTAGISALTHNKPLKVMGRALYDIKGITYQGHLHQFWKANFKPDMKLFRQFRFYLLENTQINAVYYGKKQYGTNEKI